MAPPKAGKTQFNVRLKTASIEDYKDIASRAGHASHAMLCAEILEDCLTYLMDGERTRMPDVLMELKQKLPATQIHRAHAKLTAPTAEQQVEQLLEQKIDAILRRKLPAIARLKTARRAKP
ncbi:MAG: hypothetical protein LBD30_08045 [Verrucomicrobiales bacterium]|jgi:hypothetical protein|nr:hypothetical protein [Verrucomicrobiales bacterium]